MKVLIALVVMVVVVAAVPYRSSYTPSYGRRHESHSPGHDLQSTGHGKTNEQKDDNSHMEKVDVPVKKSDPEQVEEKSDGVAEVQKIAQGSSSSSDQVTVPKVEIPEAEKSDHPEKSGQEVAPKSDDVLRLI